MTKLEANKNATCLLFFHICRKFEFDATATPSSLASLKSRMVWPFWCWLTQVVLAKRPPYGCLSVCQLQSCVWHTSWLKPSRRFRDTKKLQNF